MTVEKTARIRMKTGSTAQWAAVPTLVLLYGEIGVEITDAGKRVLYIGDGTTEFQDLEPFETGVSAWADITGIPDAIQETEAAFTSDLFFKLSSLLPLIVDTTANFTSGDAFPDGQTTLAVAQRAYDLTVGKEKLGDGTTAWIDLPYIEAGDFGTQIAELTALINSIFEDELSIEVATKTQILLGTAGNFFVDPAGMVARWTPIDGGEVSGTLALSGSAGKMVAYTMTDDTTIGTSTDTLEGSVFRRFVGGADGPHSLDVSAAWGIVSGVTFPLSVETGEEVLIEMSVQAYPGGVRRSEILRVIEFAVPEPVAPAWGDLTVSPPYSDTSGVTFTLDESDVTGNPAPTITSRTLKLNDVAQGEVANPYSAPAGFRGDLEWTCVATNTEDSATKTVVANIGPKIPTVVGEIVHRNPSGSSGTLAQAFDFSGLEPVDGDKLLVHYVNQTPSDVTIAGMVQVGGTIQRATSAAGNNQWIQLMYAEVDETLAAAGTITINLLPNSMSVLQLVRGLPDSDHISFDNTLFSRSALLGANTLVLPEFVSTEAALGIVVATSGRYPTGVGVGTIPDWTAGEVEPVAILAGDNDSIYGVRTYRKKLSAETITGLTLTCGAGANKTITGYPVLLYGEDNPA